MEVSINQTTMNMDDNKLYITFVTLDYITGVIRAFAKKEISSSVGLIGIGRKSLILVVLIVGVLIR